MKTISKKKVYVPQGFYHGAIYQEKDYPANFYVNNITKKQIVPENYPQNYYRKVIDR